MMKNDTKVLNDTSFWMFLTASDASMMWRRKPWPVSFDIPWVLAGDYLHGVGSDIELASHGHWEFAYIWAMIMEIALIDVCCSLIPASSCSKIG
jgi:hypothetical protein